MYTFIVTEKLQIAMRFFLKYDSRYYMMIKM